MSWLNDLWSYLAKPTPITKMREEALYETERELHKAQLNYERARADRDMLTARRQRQQQELNLVTIAASVPQVFTAGAGLSGGGSAVGVCGAGHHGCP